MALAYIPLAVETFGETQSPNGVSPQFVSPMHYNSIHNLLTKEEQTMTITYSIWQGSKLISVNNVAHEVKAIDHLINSLNDSELGKGKKFTANVMDIKVGAN
jgi:hypothetical protein